MRALKKLGTPLVFLVGLLIPVMAFAQPAKVQAVATFSILGDVVKNVGGDLVDLTVLVGPDSDAHTFEPTPQDSIALNKAQVVFENGLHLEHWIDGLYQGSGSSAKRVVATGSAKIRTFAVNGNVNEQDPHVWQDVSNVIRMAETVRAALIALDPGHQSQYEANAAAYISQLQELVRWVKEQVGFIPSANRQLFTSHDALGYFADAYGFALIGAIIPSATTEAEDPSAQQTARVIDRVKSIGIKVIFIENTHSSKVAQVIARDIGVKVAPGLYTDALGKPGSSGETYIKMMRYNVSVIAEALR